MVDIAAVITRRQHETAAKRGYRTMTPPQWIFSVAAGLMLFHGCSNISEPAHMETTLAAASDTLTVTTWNIGYAGLGSESDFVKDGGERLLPPSRSAVKKNIKGIVERFQTNESDVILLQEVAKSSAMTRFVALESRLKEFFFDRFYWFHADTRVPLLPPPVGIAHGFGAISSKAVARTRIYDLPKEDKFALGIVDRNYALQVLELEETDGESWVVINVHLAAFDADGSVRKSQAKKAFEIANAYYEQGDHVILGGDWNMELAAQESQRPTNEKYPFWLVAFDNGLLLEGWGIAVDKTKPTVRTVARSYVPGENYTAIIDGFIYSPNIVLEYVSTDDTEFAFSDHMPVTARFRAVQ